MSKSDQSMFSDRRDDTDRRKQNLPIPAALDRRLSSSRRNKTFLSEPWWLRVDYAAELVVEKKPAAEKDYTSRSQNTSDHQE